MDLESEDGEVEGLINEAADRIEELMGMVFESLKQEE